MQIVPDTCLLLLKPCTFLTMFPSCWISWLLLSPDQCPIDQQFFGRDLDAMCHWKLWYSASYFAETNSAFLSSHESNSSPALDPTQRALLQKHHIQPIRWQRKKIYIISWWTYSSKLRSCFRDGRVTYIYFRLLKGFHLCSREWRQSEQNYWPSEHIIFLLI